MSEDELSGDAEKVANAQAPQMFPTDPAILQAMPQFIRDEAAKIVGSPTPSEEAKSGAVTDAIKDAIGQGALDGGVQTPPVGDAGFNPSGVQSPPVGDAGFNPSGVQSPPVGDAGFNPGGEQSAPGVDAAFAQAVMDELRSGQNERDGSQTPSDGAQRTDQANDGGSWDTTQSPEQSFADSGGESPEQSLGGDVGDGGVSWDAGESPEQTFAGVGESGFVGDDGFSPEGGESGFVGDDGFSPEGGESGFVGDDGFSPEGGESGFAGDDGFSPEGGESGFVGDDGFGGGTDGAEDEMTESADEESADWSE